MVWVGRSYPSAEMQSACFTALADWAVVYFLEQIALSDKKKKNKRKK